MRSLTGQLQFFFFNFCANFREHVIELEFNGTFRTERLYRAFRSYAFMGIETPWESCTSPIQ